MSAETTRKDPPFFCPKCGQKHRASLAPLRDTPGSTMRATCARCGIALTVSLGPDDQPRCEVEAAKPPVVPTAPVVPPKVVVPPVARDPGVTAEAPAPDEGWVPPAAGRTTPAAPAAPSAPAPAPGGGSGEPPPEFEKGAVVGRYTIESRIGVGGTGSVYRAFDPTTNRTVALKIIHTGLPESMRQRFFREIEVQANIRHQNIMPVFDRGSLPDGRPYFTMELLYEPLTLTEVVDLRQQGKIHRERGVRDLESLEKLVSAILVPICEGIYVANVENGVIHRDLKPDNALVDSRTLRPYVIDFGICHRIEKAEGLSSAVVAPTSEEAGIVGTPRFLSPEQARGSVHARTDVWGLGALLHFVLSGEPPLAPASSITRAELGRRIQALKEARANAERQNDEKKGALIEEKLARLEDEGLRPIDEIFRDARDGKYLPLPAATPPALAAIVRKAMAPVPADRYVNARQLAADLQAWLKKGRVRAVTEFGGTAAAVDTARRAVRKNLVRAVWVAVGLAVGLAVGAAVAGRTGGSAEGSMTAIERDIEGLQAEFENDYSGAGTGMDPVAANRVWRVLDRRAQVLAQRLAAEPASAEHEALTKRLAFVRDRFAPQRVRLELPAGAAVAARNETTQERVEVKPGENALPPGLYRVLVGSGGRVQVQFPVRMPFVARTAQQDPAGEAALQTFRVPIPPDSVPEGMVLVVGGTVRVRDLPFSDPSGETNVAPFLVDAREVTLRDYIRYLRTLSPKERGERAPQTADVEGSAERGYDAKNGREGVPVTGIRPEDAVAYAAWRAQQEGAVVRLPTEAEWVLVAGGALGWPLPNGSQGLVADAHLVPPLEDAGKHEKDRGPYGVLGLLGNAREMVTSSYGDVPPGGVLVKGAGVGDRSDAAGIYQVRPLPAGSRDDATGFRCVREIPAER